MSTLEVTQSESLHEVVKEGLIDVKFPNPKKPIKKNWNRQRVVALISRTSESNYDSGNDVLIQFYPPSNQGQLKENELLHEIELHGPVSVFRCDSKSRSCRSFGIMRHSESKSRPATVLVYMAADDERNSEVWMAAIRDALLPPSPLVLLEEVWQERHRVSLIDTMHNFQHGLLGAYGYMSFSEDEIILVHPHIGKAIATWPWSKVRGSKLLRVDHEGSPSGVFGIVLDISKKSVDSTRRHVLAFYSPTSLAAAEQLQAKILGTNNISTQSLQPSNVAVPELEQNCNNKCEIFLDKTDNAVSSENQVIDNFCNDSSKELLMAIEMQPDINVPTITNYTNSSEMEEKKMTGTGRSEDVDRVYLSNFCDDSTSSFISGISSSIFDCGVLTLNNPSLQSGSSRSSSGSSDSSWESQMWPKLWEEFFQKQEERLLHLNGYNYSDDVVEARYENTASIADITSVKTQLDVERSFPHVTELDDDLSVNDESRADINHTMHDINNKRGSVTSILSHVYADIPSSTGFQGRGSIGGQTLYEELPDDEEYDFQREEIRKSPSPPLPPPRNKIRKPSSLQLKELSKSIQKVLSNVELTSPSTPERRRKASPTSWLNPVKGFKKIIAKEKKSAGGYKNAANTSPRDKQTEKSAEIKRTTSQPIFYYDRTELRRKAASKNYSSDSLSPSSEGELPCPFQPPLAMGNAEDAKEGVSRSLSIESPVVDLPQWDFSKTRRICLKHLLENLKKGENADTCDCSNSPESRGRSKSSLRISSYQNHQRRKSKSLCLDIERHFEIINAFEHNRLQGSERTSSRFDRQDSSDYFDMTPPSNRRSTRNPYDNAARNYELSDKNGTTDDYVYMDNLQS